MPEIAKNDESIFAAVFEMFPGERAAYLDGICGADANLRGRIEGLLRSHDKAGSFLNNQPVGLGITAECKPLAEAAGTIIGPYKLLQQIGEGGMGVVYMAEQTEPVRRRVALKIIKPGMDSTQVIGRFEAERQALAMMDHPNIAKVLDAGTIGGVRSPGSGVRGREPEAKDQISDSEHRTPDGRPYFVMELVKGVPITKFCDENQLTARERLELFIHVCQAVQHAHTKGIIHRDLKPTNVLVALYDDKPVPKVIDFGVAKATGEKLTERTMFTAFGLFVGTLEYMSPEQAKMNALDIDTRSDVYALGVLLYELLTGSTPLERSRLKQAALDEVLRLIREEDPPKPSTRLTQSGEALAISARRRTEPAKLGQVLRGELDWIVMKALEKDRTRRYETANGLARDVEHYLKDEAVEACPPTAGYRLRKFARKNQKLLATAAAFAALLVLGAAGSAWQAVRATQAEAAAVENEQAANANAAEAKKNEQDAKQQRDEVQKLNDRLLATQAQLRITLYNSQMNLAKHAWDGNGVKRVLELLDQNRPKAGETDQRGFEWHYLNRLCHSELLTLRDHGLDVHSVAYSSDGKRLASASWKDDMVRLWDAHTGQLLRSHFWPGVEGIAFSPDGIRLAVCSIGRAKQKTPSGLKIFDVKSGEVLLNINPDAQGGARCIAFSPDGKRLASGTGKSATIWDSQSGQVLLTLERDDGVTAVAFSPDGKQLATGGRGRKPPGQMDNSAFVVVWNVQTREEVLTFAVPTQGLAGEIANLAFSPDGKQLATASWTKSALVWDANTGKERLTLLGHSQGVTSVAFSPDGKRLVSGSTDGTVKVWDAHSGKEVLTFQGHNFDVWAVAYSPDGKRIASCSFDGTVKVWDAEANQERITFKPFNEKFRFKAISPDAKYLASSSQETLQVLDAQTGRELHVLKGHTSNVGKVVFSNDGKRLASVRATAKGAQPELKIWDTQTGQELSTLKMSPNKWALSPNGKHLATASSGFQPGNPKMWQGPKIWDAQTGQELHNFGMYTSSIFSLAFSPDGTRLAGGYSDGTLRFWESQFGQEILAIKGPNDKSLAHLTFSHDGKLLAGSSRDEPTTYTVRIWASDTGQVISSLKGHIGAIGCITFSPDGKRLASWSNNETVKLWDVQTGQETLNLKVPGTVSALTFTPDGHRLIACGSDGAVTIWDATPLAEKK